MSRMENGAVTALVKRPGKAWRFISVPRTVRGYKRILGEDILYRRYDRFIVLFGDPMSCAEYPEYCVSVPERVVSNPEDGIHMRGKADLYGTVLAVYLDQSGQIADMPKWVHMRHGEYAVANKNGRYQAMREKYLKEIRERVRIWRT